VQHIVSRHDSHCPESGFGGGHTTGSPVLSSPALDDSSPPLLASTVVSPALVEVDAVEVVDGSTAPDDEPPVVSSVVVVLVVVPGAGPVVGSVDVDESTAVVPLLVVPGTVVGIIVVVPGAIVVSVVPPVLSSPHPPDSSPRSTNPRESPVRMTGGRYAFAPALPNSRPKRPSPPPEVPLRPPGPTRAPAQPSHAASRPATRSPSSVSVSSLKNSSSHSPGSSSSVSVG